MKRRDARELVLKSLFAWEMEKGDPFRQLAYIAGDEEMSGFDMNGLEEHSPPEEDGFVRRLLAGITENKTELDAIIADYARDWDLSRLGGAERNVLRMGIFEMLYDEKLPPAVAINEAVDLIKKYGSDEAAGFINGILDNHELRRDGFVQDYRERRSGQ